MLDFYRRFVPHEAAHQAPLHDVLFSPRVTGSHPFIWTPELHKALEECKVNLSYAILLAHPDPSASLALVKGASMDAVLQQRINNAWQPIVFFSKKLNPDKQKYSTYDHEFLDIYETVKDFRHMLEARHFVIFTDNKSPSSTPSSRSGTDANRSNPIISTS
jgi:hypothetical protein